MNNPNVFTDPDGNCSPGVDCSGIARAFESGVNRISKAIGLDKMSFKLEGTASAKIGLAAGFKVKEASLFEVSAEANAFSFDLASGSADFTDPLNPDSYTGNHTFNDSETSITQGVGVGIKEKVFDKVGLGVEISHEVSDIGDPSTSKNTSSITLGVEVYSGNSKKTSPDGTASAKTEDNKTCYCIDFGVAAQLVLGIELNLQVGIEVEE